MFTMLYCLIWQVIPMTEFISGMCLGELATECVVLWTMALRFTLKPQPRRVK